MLEKLYKKIFPILNRIPPELAHNLAIKFFSKYREKIKLDDHTLNSCVCDLKFTNPVGLAAGFDKNGEAYHGLMTLGFGFVEMADSDQATTAMSELNGNAVEGREIKISEARPRAY